MITTDQELNNPEQLQVVQPDVNQEQVQAPSLKIKPALNKQ